MYSRNASYLVTLILGTVGRVDFHSKLKLNLFLKHKKRRPTVGNIIMLTTGNFAKCSDKDTRKTMNVFRLVTFLQTTRAHNQSSPAGNRGLMREV